MERIAAVLTAVLVAAGATGLVTVADLPEVGPGSAASTAAAGGTEADADHDHADHDDCARYTGCFDPGHGSIPSAEAAEDLEEVRSIRIVGDDEFTPAEGVRSGSGTRADPYVITGYHVTGDLYIQDTDACVVVAENYVSGQLSLNWNGPCVHVHHNHVDDLRVNENIKRTGYATGGIIEDNAIEVVGQLRHFDGVFRENEVGPEQPDSLWDRVRETVRYPFHEDPRVANVDGFNQGRLHNNTFHGSVDLDFHGHHHGSSFFAPTSHYHGNNESLHAGVDHTDRWTSVRFADNVIDDPDGYGLRYEDRAHSADDETAASETIEELEAPHVHHTRVEIVDNTVRKAGIWVDVFHAEDEDHEGGNEGWLVLRSNTVRLHERDPDGPLGVPLFHDGYRLDSAIRVHGAKELQGTIAGNDLAFVADDGDGDGPADDVWPERDPKPRAIDLDVVKLANLTVTDNAARNFRYGVHAQHMPDSTHWIVAGNVFGDAEHDVWYDGTVENEPGRG